MIAQICDLNPGDFIHTCGDTHIYKNHVDALKIQIERKPNEFPKLKLNNEIKNIEDFTFDDIKLENYYPQETIKMTMAV
jgi:thymidylate synthase